MNSPIFVFLALISFTLANPSSPPNTGYGNAGYTSTPPSYGKEPNRCAGKRPGWKYCKDAQTIATCQEHGVTATDCGRSVSPTGKQIIGRCITSDTGSGYCKQPHVCEYEGAGFQFCEKEGGSGIMTCEDSKNFHITLCTALVKGKVNPYTGKCYTVNGKGTCENIANDGPCKGKRPGSYCENGNYLRCPEGECKACPNNGKCVSTGPDDREAKCVSTTPSGYGK